MYSVGPDESGDVSCTVYATKYMFPWICVLRGRISQIFVGFTTTKYVYEAAPCTSWSLFQCDEVGQDDRCHGFHYHRGTKGEAYVVTARHLKSVHLAGLEVECLLCLADA